MFFQVKKTGWLDCFLGPVWLAPIVNVKLKSYLIKSYRDVQMDTDRQLADDAG